MRLRVKSVFSYEGVDKIFTFLISVHDEMSHAINRNLTISQILLMRQNATWKVDSKESLFVFQLFHWNWHTNLEGNMRSSKFAPGLLNPSILNALYIITLLDVRCILWQLIDGSKDSLKKYIMGIDLRILWAT